MTELLKSYYLRSPYKDPFVNLALEEYLLDHGPEDGVIFLSYVNSPCVIIGKNQNPWLELSDGVLAGDRPWARRISGGGAVYHDEGNWNYSFIVPRNTYCQKVYYQFIIQLLGGFNLNVEQTGKSNLSVGGKKISGNAFCYRRNKVIHHGTILVDANLDALRNSFALNPPVFNTHAISSVPASVVNLSALHKDISIALIETAYKAQANAEPLLALSADLIDMRSVELAKAEWKIGLTPRFSFEKNGERIEVVKGKLHTEWFAARML